MIDRVRRGEAIDRLLAEQLVDYCRGLA